MIRARKLANVHQKRSIRPLYAHTSAVPFACFLDTSAVASTTVIFPGMVAKKTAGEMVAVCGTATTDVPFGLFGNFINGDFDELGDSTECSVWRGGPDAEFEILGDALGTASSSWTALDAAANNGKLLYSDGSGKLTDTQVSTQRPVARVVSAPSLTKIIVTLELGYATTSAF